MPTKFSISHSDRVDLDISMSQIFAMLNGAHAELKKRAESKDASMEQ